MLNWGGRLLPFLEQPALWHTTEQFYADQNAAAIAAFVAGVRVPLKVFLCPTDSFAGNSPLPPLLAETTNYLGAAGRSAAREDGLLFLDSSVRLAQVIDGTSTTLLVGERPINAEIRGGRWQGGWGHWGTGDAYLGVRETAVSADICPDYPYAFRGGDKADPCSAYHFWSYHPGGANFLFADGSVRFLTYSANEILPALATRDGGETVAE